MNSLRAGVAVVLFAFVCSSPIGLLMHSEGSSSPPTWTIMLYMAGDALPELPWLDNINSMEAADQALGTSIIALVDPLGDGNTQLLRIQQDPNGLDAAIASTPIEDNGEVIPVTGEVNMADPHNLTRFLQFTEAHYPAERKMLVLWGHGSGWYGICPDGGDIMTLPELDDALGAVGSGYSLDMITVDACAAASFEMLLEIVDRADYFVAAENNVPFQGLPYTAVLNDLAADPSVSVHGFGSIIARDYIDAAATVSPYSTTMGVFNLSRVQQTISTLSSLSTVGLMYDDIFHSAINEALVEAESYDIAYYFDFGDFLKRLQLGDLPLEIKTKAIEATQAYDQMIVSFEKYNHPDPVDGIGVANATGAAIYAPSTSFTDALYADLTIARTDWYDFGRAARIVKPTMERERGPSLTFADSSTDNDTLADSVTLAWPSTYDEYWIFVYRREPGGYDYIATGVSTAPTFTISSWIGDLLVTASGRTSGVALTYDEFNVTLYGTVVVTVNLTMDGQAPSKPYDVRVTLAGMTWYHRAEGGAAKLNISVPGQADVGEMLDFDAVSPGSDKVVGSARAIVQDEDFSVDITVYSQPKEPSGTIGLALFSILPGALVLLFAFMIYREGKRQMT